LGHLLVMSALVAATGGHWAALQLVPDWRVRAALTWHF